MAFKSGITQVSAIPFANKWLVTIDLTGPALYSRTTGFVLNANTSGLNFSGFEFVDSVLDTAGSFEMNVQMNLAGYGNAVPSVILRPYATSTATIGGQSQTVGTEAANNTNLSTFSFRLQLFCV